MRLFIQSCSVVALLVASSAVFACCGNGGGYDYTKEDMSGYNLQPNFHVNSDSDYARNGSSFYFYAGYMFTNRFLKSSTQKATSGASTITYSPKDAIPDQFHGFEIGFGKELSRHIDMQLAYLQNLRETRNSTINGSASKISGKMNGAQALAGYVFNPDDEIQIMAKAGVLIYEFNETILVGSVDYSPSTSPVRINPEAGLELVFQFSKHTAFRVSSMFAYNTYGSASSGDMNTVAGLSYII